MDELAQNSTSPQAERELHSPPSPKRPRTDFPVPNDHSGRSRFNFPELLTFGNTIQSLTNVSQNNAGQECVPGCVDTENGKAETQQQDSLFLIPKIIASHNNEADKGSSDPCFITPEISVLEGKNEHAPAHETDKYSSNAPDDAGGALAESHTSKDASADTSSHPDCGRLGKSLKDEPPCGGILPAGDDKDRRQVLNGVSQSQAFSTSSSVEQVRYLSDCTYEEMLCDPGFCHAWSKPAGTEKSIQRSAEDGFSASVLKREAASPISSIDYADSKSSYSVPEEDPSGSMPEGVRNEEEISELQICGNVNVAVCDAETKAEVNENGMGKISFPSAAQCTEGSVTSYNMALVRNTTSETVGPEDDGCCGAKEASAAGEMIAKTESETPDHTTETPMPARTSEEAAEGDNDASPFGVIDPAIWRESDGEAEQKHSDSESNEGVELNSFEEIRGVEMALCPDVQPSKEESASGKHRTDEEEDTEPQECPSTTKEIHGNTESDEGYSEGNPGPSSSQFHPAEDKTLENPEAVGDQEQANCLPDSLDQLLREEVEFLWAEIAEMCGTNKGEDTTGLEIKGDKGGDFVDLKEKPLQTDQEHKEETLELCVHDFITEWEEGKIGKLSDEKTHADNPGCLYDHPYSAVIQMIEWETKENAGVGVEESGIKNSSEVPVQQEDSQQKKDTTEESSDECISEQTREKMSRSEDKLILNGQHQQTNELSCFSEYQPKPETDDLLSFTSPPSSDAVIPAPQELRHPQKADKNPTAIMCSDRFSPAPSAFTLCDRVHGAFDTFEKIQFSLDDDGDGDFGLSSSPMLTSLSEQPPQKPHMLISLPPLLDAERKERPQEEDREGKEEDVETSQCRSDNMTNGLSSCDYSGDELLNSILAADVPAHGWTDQKPDCESPLKSSEGLHDELKQQSVPNTVSSKCDKPASDQEGFKEEFKQQAMPKTVSRTCNSLASGEDERPDDCHMTEQNPNSESDFHSTEQNPNSVSDSHSTEQNPNSVSDSHSTEQNPNSVSDSHSTEQNPNSVSDSHSTELNLNSVSVSHSTELNPNSESDFDPTEQNLNSVSDSYSTELNPNSESNFDLTEQNRKSESDFHSTEQNPNSVSDSHSTEQNPNSVSDSHSTEQNPNSESGFDLTEQNLKSESDFDLMEQNPNSESNFHLTKQNPKSESDFQPTEQNLNSESDFHLMEQNPNFESAFQSTDSFHEELLPQSMPNNISSQCDGHASAEEYIPDDLSLTVHRPNPKYGAQSSEGLQEESKPQAVPKTSFYKCDSSASGEDDNPDDFDCTEENHSSESALKSFESFHDDLKSMPNTVSTTYEGPASDLDNIPKFEMKKQFDKVLRELNLFFEVSRSEFESYSIESSPEQCVSVTEAWESNTSNYKDHLMGGEKDKTSDDAGEVRCLDVCGSGPLLSRTPGKDDGEQEVPNSSSTEVSMSMMDPAEDPREPPEMDPKRKLWSPSFMCQTLLEQLSHKPPEPVRRLEPLRTCARPLRVGLSKRAKTRHLHRPHPYKQTPEM